jgi:hypothetical protein
MISSRHTALRAGNRSGLLAGILLRGVPVLVRDDAHLRKLALASPVFAPERVALRWKSLFTRSFVKAAVHAARTERDVSASSKYGMP